MDEDTAVEQPEHPHSHSHPGHTTRDIGILVEDRFVERQFVGCCYSPMIKIIDCS